MLEPQWPFRSVIVFSATLYILVKLCSSILSSVSLCFLYYFVLCHFLLFDISCYIVPFVVPFSWLNAYLVFLVMLCLLYTVLCLFYYDVCYIGLSVLLFKILCSVLHYALCNTVLYFKLVSVLNCGLCNIVHDVIVHTMPDKHLTTIKTYMKLFTNGSDKYRYTKSSEVRPWSRTSTFSIWNNSLWRFEPLINKCQNQLWRSICVGRNHTKMYINLTYVLEIMGECIPSWPNINARLFFLRMIHCGFSSWNNHIVQTSI